MKKNLKAYFLIFLILSENILFFHYLLLKKRNGEVLSSYDYSDSCSLACQEMMNQKIAVALAGISGTGSRTGTAINYIPLGDGGSTISRDWVVVEGSEFIFNLADYSSGAKVYWEGNLKARDDNSRCYARIYDQTHYREVDYSQQSTNETSFQSLTSQALSIWRGSNHYRLEIKSLNGVICYLETPRLIVRY